MRIQLYFALAFTLCFQALIVPDLEGLRIRKFSSDSEANAYLRCHYEKGLAYYASGNWKEAADEFKVVTYFFPDSKEAAQAYYLMGTAYFQVREYDFANDAFSHYLVTASHPTYFQETMQYKFGIAEAFKTGCKRRYWTMRYFPKWASGQEMALEIYDEIAKSLPGHELAVAALLSKGDLLREMWDYRAAVETYQTIIRRFPDNPIVPLCYLKIGESYVEQSRYEFQNPDIISLAELNRRKFSEEFPQDQRMVTIDEGIAEIRESFAKGLADIGMLYERKGKPRAAAIYYRSALETYPNTRVADVCACRLASLKIDAESCPILEENPSFDEEGANESL